MYISGYLTFFFLINQTFLGCRPEKLLVIQPYFLIGLETNPYFQNKNVGYAAKLLRLFKVSKLVY